MSDGGLGMAKRRLLIWGGGGHGKVVADLARSLHWEVVGFVDANESMVGEVVEPGGACVLYAQGDFLERISKGSITEHVDAVVVAIGDGATRDRCLRQLPKDIIAPALVHPSACVSPSASLGCGVVVFAHAVVNAASSVADGVILNTGSVVEHDCRLGPCAHLSPRATLCGSVVVGARSWVGAGSVVIQALRVGADVMVGAGAVVIRDVEDGMTVVGNPARLLCMNSELL